jgi:hypothetical protein
LPHFLLDKMRRIRNRKFLTSRPFQILAAGPIVSTIVGALEGAAVIGGVDAIGAGLYSLGIPKDSVLQYQTALKANKFVVVAHGTPEEIARAKQIMLSHAHA